jgi:hypothetical protein
MKGKRKIQFQRSWPKFWALFRNLFLEAIQMAVTSINTARTVPVQEDLRDSGEDFSIIRGWEHMHRVPKELSTSSISFKAGEWAVLGNNGKLVRPSATPVLNTFLAYEGSERFDVMGSGTVGIVMSSKVLVQTKRFDASQTYSVGDKLTVKDTGGGTAVVTKAVGADPVLAIVTGIPSVNAGSLEYQTA